MTMNYSAMTMNYSAIMNYSAMDRGGCNFTLLYARNLTSSYADQNNESTMVATSVAMFLLAVLFFNVNLFSRLSDVSAIVNPTVRICLSTALSLFLPVMSYLFSEAKNKADVQGTDSAATVGGIQKLQYGGAELSLRARTILMWMLLVELLRKKVEAILVNSGMQWYSGTIDRASRVTWLGYLVFNNVKSVGKRAIYGTLWVFAATKLLQRVFINELIKRSFAYGKNAQLLDSYMAQLMRHEAEQPPPPAELEGSELLKTCKYAVMGEDNIKMKAGPEGYHLELGKTSSTADVPDIDGGDSTTPTPTPTITTVGDIWTLADDGILKDDFPRLKRLCLSFALYKLLRRKFEDLPITAAETQNCQDLIFRGLRRELLQQEKDDEAADATTTMFQVFDEEVQFLCEYYHSVLPVVLSSPFFFLANYILFPILVWSFCILTFILCGNGNVVYAFKSIPGDNYIISKGAMSMTVCLLRGIKDHPEVLFSTIDLGITILLLLTFIYEEVWEFIVFILSNWFIVSLLCEYAAKREWRNSRRAISRVVRCILWVRSKLSRHNLCFRQFSVMWFPRLTSIMMPTAAVPRGVKKSIMEYLTTHVINGGAPRRDGWSVLQSDKHRRYHDILLWACRDDRSCAEVILIFHIATSVLEVKYRVEKKKKEKGVPKGTGHRKVAETLSKYCAYLVALYPELLPEDKDGTARVYKEMKQELKKELGGCVMYHLSQQRARYKKLKEIGRRKKEQPKTVVQEGAELGMKLAERDDEAGVWELLADLWTELMVYVAPSSGELHVKAHKEALAQGGEFITVLWAIATHTGITRPAKPWSVIRVEDVEEGNHHQEAESKVVELD